MPNDCDAICVGIVVLTRLGRHADVLKGALEELVVVEGGQLDLRIGMLPCRDLLSQRPGIEVIRSLIAVEMLSYALDELLVASGERACGCCHPEKPRLGRGIQPCCP